MHIFLDIFTSTCVLYSEKVTLIFSTVSTVFKKKIKAIDYRVILYTDNRRNIKI